MRGAAQRWARRPLGVSCARSPAPAGVGVGRGEAALKRRGSGRRNIFPRQILQQSALSCSSRVPLSRRLGPLLSDSPAAARPLQSPGRGNAPRAQPLGLAPGAPALCACPGGCGSAYPEPAAALRSPPVLLSVSASFPGPQLSNPTPLHPHPARGPRAPGESRCPRRQEISIAYAWRTWPCEKN